jgi:hypothetical protein
LLAEEHAQRRSYFITREQPGCSLIQHGAKQVIIALIDEGDSDRGFSQGAGSIEAAEPASYNHNSRT